MKNPEIQKSRAHLKTQKNPQTPACTSLQLLVKIVSINAQHISVSSSFTKKHIRCKQMSNKQVLMQKNCLTSPSNSRSSSGLRFSNDRCMETYFESEKSFKCSWQYWWGWELKLSLGMPQLTSKLKVVHWNHRMALSMVIKNRNNRNNLLHKN